MRLIPIMILLALYLVSCRSASTCNLSIEFVRLQTYDIYNDNVAEINQYLANNNLQADTLDSGIRYINVGSCMDSLPQVCDAVTLNYKGYLLDGTVFDTKTENVFDLESNIIDGWKIALTELYCKGDTGTIIIPSYLAYGLNPPAASGISENEVLIFDLRLVSFD